MAGRRKRAGTSEIEGPLKPFAAIYTSRLRSSGYTASTIAKMLRQAAHLSRWMQSSELEHLVHAFFTLDAQVSHELDGERSPATDGGRNFYLVLVRALLHALEMDSPSRAAFADQLRSSWPIAVAAT